MSGFFFRYFFLQPSRLVVVSSHTQAGDWVKHTIDFWLTISDNLPPMGTDTEIMLLPQLSIMKSRVVNKNVMWFK